MSERTAPVHVGAATWAVVRERYLGGVPAPALSERYGVKVDTLYKRARREGWSRRGQARAAGPPEALEPLFPTSGGGEVFPEPAEVSQAAVHASDRAMRQGRLEEAIKLARLAEVLRRVHQWG